ncbi:MAG: transglycosylase SLT domain-containing protein [bacterium]
MKKLLIAVLLVLCTFKPLCADRIADLARCYNPTLKETEALKIEKSILRWTRKRNIDLCSFLAIIAQESAFDPMAEGGAGEKGLCQVSKTCLKELRRIYGIDFKQEKLFIPDYNIQVGSLYYRYCAILANNNRREAIARYRTTFRPGRSGYYAWKVLQLRKTIHRLITRFGFEATPRRAS